jgi:hypothetical protein
MNIGSGVGEECLTLVPYGWATIKLVEQTTYFILITTTNSVDGHQHIITAKFFVVCTHNNL